MFETVAAEPVPDRFVSLLEQLEATAAGQETVVRTRRRTSS